MASYRVQHRLLETSFSERGKLPLKLAWPVGISTSPPLLNKCEIRLCPKNHLPSRASQGHVQLAPLPFFGQIYLQQGKWLQCMLSYCSNMFIICGVWWYHTYIQNPRKPQMYVFVQMQRRPLHSESKHKHVFT